MARPSVRASPHAGPLLPGDVRRDAKRGGIIELQLNSTQLFELSTAIATGQHPGWAPVITDITDRYRRGVLDTETHLTNTGIDPPEDAGDSTRPRAHPDQDARRRRARAGLRRWIEVRDRYCLHPACRMPATQTDQDHRIDYAAGGPTTGSNLDSECRHDHCLQHDGGWVVHRPPGSDPLTGPIIWTSPLGHTYETRPPPVMQPYPQPASHYPNEAGLPSWFASIVKTIKADQQAAAETARRNAEPEHEHEPETRAGKSQQTTTEHQAEPPF